MSAERADQTLPAWKIGLALLLVALAVAGQLAVLEVRSYLAATPETPGRETVVTIERGWTLAQAAERLERQRVVSDARAFLLLARAQRLRDRLRGRDPLTLRAGEFRLSTGWTPLRVLDELRSGRELLHRLTIPEGLPWWEVAKLVEAAGLGSRASFEAAMRDPALLGRYGIPAATAEGYLLPQTYLLPSVRDNDARPVAEAMLAQFAKAAREVWPVLPPPQRLRELVILASIVEKETADPAERPRVAGVYANRLRIGMPLQADPTVIYGLGPAFDGDLKRRHLEDAGNPYNTYRHPGLPPGPIASPGAASLRAAAFPENHPYLYFVARGNGSHQFSRTLEEHNRAVREFQLGR